MIDALGFDPGFEVEVGSSNVSLGEAMTRDLEITASNLNFLRSWADFSGSDELEALLAPGNKEQLSEFIDEHQIIDIIRRFPASPGPQEFVSILRKLSPRLNAGILP